MATTIALIIMGLICLFIFFLEAVNEHNEYRNSKYHSYCGKQHKRNRNQYLLLTLVGVLVVIYNILILVFQ